MTNQASGFIYYVSLKGVTGAATLDTAEAAARIQKSKMPLIFQWVLVLVLVMLLQQKQWVMLLMP